MNLYNKIVALTNSVYEFINDNLQPWFAIGGYMMLIFVLAKIYLEVKE